jgi:hypothetical protein
VPRILIGMLATKIFIALYKNELEHIFAITFIVFQKLKSYDYFNFYTGFLPERYYGFSCINIIKYKKIRYHGLISHVRRCKSEFS